MTRAEAIERAKEHLGPPRSKRLPIEEVRYVSQVEVETHIEQAAKLGVDYSPEQPEKPWLRAAPHWTIFFKFPCGPNACMSPAGITVLVFDDGEVTIFPGL